MCEGDRRVGGTVERRQEAIVPRRTASPVAPLPDLREMVRAAAATSLQPQAVGAKVLGKGGIETTVPRTAAQVKTPAALPDAPRSSLNAAPVSAPKAVSILPRSNPIAGAPNEVRSASVDVGNSPVAPPPADLQVALAASPQTAEVASSIARSTTTVSGRSLAGTSHQMAPVAVLPIKESLPEGIGALRETLKTAQANEKNYQEDPARRIWQNNVIQTLCSTLRKLTGKSLFTNMNQLSIPQRKIDLIHDIRATILAVDRPSESFLPAFIK